jgi:hypothetical protein
MRDIHRRARTAQSALRDKKPKLRAPLLTPEETARLSAFDAVIERRDDWWTSMSAKERAEELAAWEKIKSTVNGDRAGYRQVFVDG